MFAPQLEQLAEQVVVLRPCPVEELVQQLRASRPVGGEGEERDVVGVLGADPYQAVRSRLVRLDEVGGQAGELLGRQRHVAYAVADVLGELLRQLGLALGELSEPGADVLVLVDTRAVEVAQRQAQHPASAGVEGAGVDRGQRLEERPVESDLGEQPVGLLLGALTAGADRLVGVDVGEQGGDREGVGQREVDLVPQLEGALAVSGTFLQRGHASSGALELVVAAGAQPGLPVVLGEGQRGQRGYVVGHGREPSQRPSPPSNPSASTGPGGRPVRRTSSSSTPRARAARASGSRCR